MTYFEYSIKIEFMQDEKFKLQKCLVLNLIGKELLKLRMVSKKSLLMFGYENAISTSSISSIERGLTDAQITTLWRILEAHNIKISDFFKIVEQQLGDDFLFKDE